MDEQDVKIAVLENEVRGLREQQKAHKEEITKAISDLAEKFFEQVGDISDDIKDIYQFINQSKGYLAAVVLGGSILGGAVVAIASKIMDHIWK